MKFRFTLFIFCTLFFGTLQAQLYPNDYDKIDFAFDSLYSINYQKHLREQDSLALIELYKNLQETFNNAQGQKELVISNSSIHSLPLGFEKLTSLESLVFANCKNLQLDKVCEQLKALPNLKSLEISNSKLYQLPENIGALTQLTSLSVKENKIVVLPNSLVQLSQLKSLNVSNNGILNEDLLFDLLVQIPSLENLQANYCNIRALPRSASEKNWNQLSLAGNLLVNMPFDLKARDLNLSANPYLDLTSLFKNVSTCKNLKTLDVSYNKWQSLPADLGLLSAVSHLNLRGNQLTALPEEIGKLVNLKVLKIDNPDKYLFTNRLTSLPASFGNLVQLDSLFLSGNALSTLPANFSKMTNLRYLDLSWNQFNSFPKAILDLKELQYLNLAINHVMLVPNEVCSLSKLQYLNLQGDFFVNYTLKIKDLPTDLGNLKELETLILSDNVIETLPESLGNCTKIHTLDVKDNLLSTLPSTIGNLKALKTMNLKANEITQLPASFASLSALEKLDVSFNFNINGDQTAAYLAKLKNLSYLNISDCYFSENAVNGLLDALPTTQIITFTPRKEKKD